VIAELEDLKKRRLGTLSLQSTVIFLIKRKLIEGKRPQQKLRVTVYCRMIICIHR